MGLSGGLAMRWESWSVLHGGGEASLQTGSIAGKLDEEMSQGRDVNFQDWCNLGFFQF